MSTDFDERLRRDGEAIAASLRRCIEEVAAGPHASVLERGARIRLSPEAAALIVTSLAHYIDQTVLPADATLSDACEQYLWDMHNFRCNTPHVPPRLARLQERAWQSHLAACPEGCDVCVEPEPG